MADVLNNATLATLARSKDESTLKQNFQTTKCLDSLSQTAEPTTAAQAFLLQRYPWAHFQFCFAGNISLPQLRAACTSLITRYSILRTVFVEREGQVLQLVLRELQGQEYIQEITTDEPLDAFCQSLSKLQQGGPIVNAKTSPTLFTLVSNSRMDQHQLLLRLAHAQYDIITIPRIVETLAEVYNGALPSPLDFGHYLGHHAQQNNDDKAYAF